MLSRLFQQLFASAGVVFRTIRAFFTRALSGVIARVKSATSLTRQAAKLAPAMMKTAAAAGKKPSKREDYIETRQMLISKSFLIMAAAVIVVAAALFWFVGRPWLVSRFFTAELWHQDPEAADYSGKVILYYEKEKDTVLFEGRLEEGVIQGRGSAFDENGRPVYTGDYVDGLYHGEGKLYTDGALTYVGSFADGLYEGEGRLYGEGEALVYEGGFSSGLRSGEGTAYENGEKRYRGGFEQDAYSGVGTLYDGTGSPLYEGEFLDGAYDGSGTLSLPGGITVEASFQEGEVLGDARCFVRGKLYYEGGLTDLLPEGTGTVYGADGKALYTGPMKNGAVDGGALLGLPADDVREMLDGRGQERAGAQGFAIASPALGLTVFCSFAQEDAAPTAYYAYLYGPAERGDPSLLWQSAAEFEAAAMNDETAPKPAGAYAAEADFPVEVTAGLGDSPYCRTYRYEGYSLRLWSADSASAPLLGEWRLDGELPEPTGAPTASEGSDGRLNALLGQLGLKPSGGGDRGEGNPYYGGGDPGRLLEGAAADERTAVLTAALSYFEHAERRVAAEENLALCQTLLEQARGLTDLGQGDAEELSRLEDMAARLDVEIMKHVVQMRKDARTVSELSGLEPQDFDLQRLPLLFEVAELDAAALAEEAVALAMEAALAAAQPPSEEGGEPIVEPVDADAVRRQVEDSLLELELARQEVQLALREHESAVEAVEKLSRDHAMGTVSEEVLTAARMSANELRAALYIAVAGFARQAAELNDVTGGLLAVQIGWLPGVLDQL